MSSDRNGIQALETGIMAQARDEAQRILGEAEAKARTIRQQAQAQAEAERKAIVQRAEDEVRRIGEGAIANAQLEAQSLKLRRREQLLGRVFAAARQELPALQDSPDYPQVVRHLLREAVDHLAADEVRVRADPKTQEALEAGVLAEIAAETGVRIVLGEPLTRGLGVVVETPDSHRRLDNTFETRLSRMQESLRAPVYHLLMGEQP